MSIWGGRIGRSWKFVVPKTFFSLDNGALAVSVLSRHGDKWMGYPMGADSVSRRVATRRMVG